MVAYPGGTGPPEPENIPPGGPDEAGTAGLTAGNLLRTSRESAGISVADVAAATKLRSLLIGELERDDFSHCGGEVYARGHLRTIARAVGADPAAVLTRYERQTGSTPPGPTADVAFRPERRVATTSRRPGSWWLVAAAAVVVVIVAAVVLAENLHHTGRPVAAPHPSTHAAHRTHPSHPPSDTASSTPKPSSSVPPGGSASASASSDPGGVQLQITASSAPSWVQVTTASGQQLYEGILNAGQQRTFSDPTSLSVRFGYSPGVTTMLNGRSLGAPCGGQQVCTTTFTPTTGR